MTEEPPPSAAFDEQLRRLLDVYMKGPDDAEGLAMVEGMINEVFAGVGSKPPKRIRLVLEGDTVHIGFEGEVP